MTHDHGSACRPSPSPGRNVLISGEYTATCHPPSSAQPPRLIIRPDDPSPSIPVVRRSAYRIPQTHRSTSSTRAGPPRVSLVRSDGGADSAIDGDHGAGDVGARS